MSDITKRAISASLKKLLGEKKLNKITVQDIADARGSTSGQTCREASGSAGRGLTRYGPIPLVQFQFYAIRTNVQVVFTQFPHE